MAMMVKKQSPRRFGMLSFCLAMAAFCGPLHVFDSRIATAADPIALGTRRELFVDRFLIDRLSNANLQRHAPHDEGVVLRFDARWEGPHAGYVTMIQDGPKLRMYYRGISELGLDGSDSLGELHSLLEVRHAAALRSCLKNSARGFHGVGQLLAQFDRQTARLFAVNVFTSLSRQHRSGGMPAISGGNQDGVDIFAIEQFTEVPVELAVRAAIMLVDKCLSGITTAGLHVGDRNALHVGKSQHRLKVISTSRADTDDAQSDFFAGSNGTITTKHMGWQNPRRGKRGG